MLALKGKKAVRLGFYLLVLLLFLLGSLGAGCASQKPAKKFPTETIRFIVGYKVGGIVDVRIRALQPFLQEVLGVPVVVENMEGSGGGIAADFVKKQKPDGYTLLVVQMPNTIALRHTMGQQFDYTKDFTPIYAFSGKDFNFVSVRADSPIKSLADLVQAAKERKLTCALAGYGSNSHIVCSLFAQIAQPKELVVVPYASSTESMTQVVGGHVDFCITSTGGAVNKMVEEGKVRGLAIAADSRLDFLPEVPTFKEQGYDVSLEGFYGVVAPAGVPGEVIKVLEDAFNRATKDERFAEACKKMGVSPAQVGSSEFGQMIGSWTKMLEDLGPILKATMQK